MESGGDIMDTLWLIVALIGVIVCVASVFAGSMVATILLSHLQNKQARHEQLSAYGRRGAEKKKENTEEEDALVQSLGEVATSLTAGTITKEQAFKEALGICGGSFPTLLRIAHKAKLGISDFR